MSCFLHPSLEYGVGTSPVRSSVPYLWLSVTFSHWGYQLEVREREKSEARLLIPSFSSAWSLEVDCVLSLWPQLLSGRSPHTALRPDANCPLCLFLFGQRSVYHASSQFLCPEYYSAFPTPCHICVDSSFINSPNCPAQGATCFLLGLCET